MDVLKLTHIAQHHAALSGKEYTQCSNFLPHDWVIAAMQEAYNEGYAQGEVEYYGDEDDAD